MSSNIFEHAIDLSENYEGKMNHVVWRSRKSCDRRSYQKMIVEHYIYPIIPPHGREYAHEFSSFDGSTGLNAYESIVDTVPVVKRGPTALEILNLTQYVNEERFYRTIRLFEDRYLKEANRNDCFVSIFQL